MLPVRIVVTRRMVHLSLLGPDGVGRRVRLRVLGAVLLEKLLLDGLREGVEGVTGLGFARVRARLTELMVGVITPSLPTKRTPKLSLVRRWRNSP